MFEQKLCCETTLTGESQIYISTPLGIEPGAFMTRNKRVVHWTSGTWCECSEIAGSAQGSPQQPTLSVVKPEGGPAVSVKPGQKSCVRSSWLFTLSAEPSEAPTEGQRSRWLFTLLTRSLVKHPLKGSEASDQITSGSPM
jgi:hypothetical protein